MAINTGTLSGNGGVEISATGGRIVRNGFGSSFCFGQQVTATLAPMANINTIVILATDEESANPETHKKTSTKIVNFHRQ
eukprot:12759885-Ditylum_brightwellii.AAC.1